MLSVIIPSVLSRQHIPGGKSAADDVRRDLDGKLTELDRRSQLSNPPGVNIIKHSLRRHSFSGQISSRASS